MLAETGLGFRLSPYLQEKLLYLGQQEVYQEAAATLEHLLALSVSAKQIERLCHTYGALYEHEAFAPAERACSEPDRTYAMVDGSMLLTKDKDETTGRLQWREMKLGRVFKLRDHLELGPDRGWIRESQYVAHFGGSDRFFEKLAPVVDPLQEVVFLGDGARWIWDRVEAFWPEAVQILDYYHCKEHLCAFAKVALEAGVWSDPSAMEAWVAAQEALLFSDQVEAVVAEIGALSCSTEASQAAQAKLLGYYGRNRERMRYGRYRRLGYMIGSGPIESAHRGVIQRRMKLSGQRWTVAGGQRLANLRVAYASGQWSQVQRLVRMAA